MQVETALNDRVIHGLRAQFSPARGSAILSQAEAMFLQAQFKSGSQSENKPETYELLEGGWIDRATEFLGFGRWAIGRPKQVRSPAEPTKDKLARHVDRSAAQSVNTIMPANSTKLSGLTNATDLFLKHIPKPEELRRPQFEWQNAIEYRNILVIGDQGSGKTTIDQALAYSLAQRYRAARYYAAIEHGGIAGLLADCTRYSADAYMLVGADLTLAKIPKAVVQLWFEVRHLIQQATGLRRGIIVTSLESHTMFGLEKSLRTSMTMMFVKTVPTNPYDRSLLKRYIDPKLLDHFEMVRESNLQLVLVWDPQYAPHGTLATVKVPTHNVLALTVPPKRQSEWWDSTWFRIGFVIALGAALAAPFWLFRWD